MRKFLHRDGRRNCLRLGLVLGMIGPGALVIPSRCAAANLLLNGGFETGDFAGWNTQGSPVATAEARFGSWAAQLAGSANLDQTFATVSGRTYKVTAWLRIAAETGSDWGGFHITATDYQSWTELGATPFLTAANYGTNWFKIAFTFTAIDAASRLGLGYFGGAGRQMTVLADNAGVFDATAANLLPEVDFVLTPAVFTNLPASQTFAVVGDDPDGAIEIVEWDFGDGSLSSAAAGERRVATPGAYTARVRVADDSGGVVETSIVWNASAPDWLAIAITNLSIAATATVQGAASGNGLEIRFSTDREVVGLAAGTSNWTAAIPLRPGWNRVCLQAQAADGRMATAESRVRFVPAGTLAVTVPQPSPAEVERWEPVEVTFGILNSAATHTQFPFETNLPRGVEFADGLTADAVFSLAGDPSEYRVPAFLNQRYRIEEREGAEWMSPTGVPVWTARFAPPADGAWSVRIEITEARGTAVSASAQFQVVPPSDPLNRGPVQPSATDSRYYEFADGTPFLGNGFGLGAFDRHRFTLDAQETFAAIGTGNATYFRLWAPGIIWGNSWQPWTSRTRPAEGTVPATMLSLDAAHGDALGALLLDVNPADWTDPTRNPLVFQGFNGQSASLEPGKSYRVRIRWRTENLAGPAGPGPHGVTVKFTGWPEPGQTTNEPALIPHVAGDTPWHVAWGDFTADRSIARNLVIALENVTGGRAFIDECAVHEILPDGALGPALNGLPDFAGHLHFSPRGGAGLDAVYRDAQDRGLMIRTVISEKQEWSLNYLSPAGLRDRRGGHFNAPATNAPTVKLHEWHWRHLAARFGAFRSFQGIEFVNEEAPGPTDHFRLLGHLARWWSRQANPKPVSTSTWYGLAEDAWKAPFATNASATDFHAYTIGNWLFPDGDPAILHDTAHYYLAFAQSWLAAGFDKPGHWGECSLYTTNYAEHPQLAADTNGVWLHKWIWARSGAAFVYPTYWDAANIFANNLHHLYGNWNRFMAGIPAANSRYRDAGASSADPRLRFAGQKDVPRGHAYLWIDNRNHTWKNVVDGVPVAPVSAALQIPMSRPGANYAVTWFDTATGLPAAQTNVAADTNGIVQLTVSGLASDTALQLQLSGESDWDGDGDGLPDQWEARYVHDLDQIDAATDLDGDGFPDAGEFIAGTAPADPASLLLLLDTGSGLFWPAASNRTYRIERSENLTNDGWEVFQDALSADLPTNQIPRPATNGFFRLRAIRPVPDS